MTVVWAWHERAWPRREGVYESLIWERGVGVARKGAWSTKARRVWMRLEWGVAYPRGAWPGRECCVDVLRGCGFERGVVYKESARAWSANGRGLRGEWHVS